RSPELHCPANHLYVQPPRLRLPAININRISFEEAQDRERAHHVGMSWISEREFVHLSGSGKTSWERAEAVSKKIFQFANPGKANMTTSGQRVNLLPLTLFDNLYRSRVLVHNILKGKHNPIVQRRFRLLRKTTHNDLHSGHLLHSSRRITNTHVREPRRYSTLRHDTTTNFLRLTLKKKGVPRSIGNIHNISASLNRLTNQVKTKTARQSTAHKVDLPKEPMKAILLRYVQPNRLDLPRNPLPQELQVLRTSIHRDYGVNFV